jgi:hypothetical protein
MAHWLVVTENTPAIKVAMNGFTGANLVRSGPNGKYLVWEWTNALDADVQKVQASGHGQILPFVPLCMINADFLG